MLTLDDTLEDAFVSEYLLRFAETEFSSENVCFLLLLRKLFRALARAEQTATLSRISRQLCTEHVQPGARLEVHLDPKVRDKLLAWNKRAVSDSSLPLPTPLWSESNTLTTRTVKHDTFKRFRAGKLCEEAMTLHPRRCLVDESCREAFTAAAGPVKLTELQSDALDYYVRAYKFDKNHVTLASGWPANETVREAQSIFETFHASWKEFGVDDAMHEMIQRQLHEAPKKLFAPTLTAALNALASPYISWLDAAEGHAFCDEHVGQGRSVKAPAKDIDSSENYLSGW